MKIKIIINDIGHLEVQCRCGCKGIRDLQFTPDELELELRCCDCHDSHYVVKKEVGHFYCTNTEKIITEMDKIPLWCPKYKHLLNTINMEQN